MTATPLIPIGSQVYVTSARAFGIVEDNSNGTYLVVFGADALDEIFGVYELDDIRWVR